MANNTGKILVSTGPYDGGNGSQFAKVLKYRPEDVPILSGHIPLPEIRFPYRSGINKNRKNAWIYLHGWLWKRFVWQDDRATFGSLDHWVSRYEDFKSDNRSKIHSDCEDLALTAIEFGLAHGILPEHMYLVECLSSSGQSSNRRKTKSKRILLNHCVALLQCEDGSQLLIDSSERRKIETVEECNLQFYNWRRVDWEPERWELCDVVDRLAPA